MQREVAAYLTFFMCAALVVSVQADVYPTSLAANLVTILLTIPYVVHQCVGGTCNNFELSAFIADVVVMIAVVMSMWALVQKQYAVSVWAALLPLSMFAVAQLIAAVGLWRQQEATKRQFVNSVLTTNLHTAAEDEDEPLGDGSVVASKKVHPSPPGNPFVIETREESIKHD